MRIPFDLIAAILCAERIGEFLRFDDAASVSTASALWVWPLVLFLSWLFHDIAARLTERRTNFGRTPDGGGRGLHPQQFHTRLTWLAQLLSVALFAAATWYLKWPLLVTRWPTWIGLPADFSIGGLMLAKSVVMDLLLTVGPYLAAMVLSWMPRRRLASSARRRLIPLISYLSFEAKISWLPLSMCMVFAALSDVLTASRSLLRVLPAEYVDILENETTQTIFVFALALLAATVLVPVAAVKLWHCTPLPDGELKDRLRVLMARSGVKARAILVWGGRGSGMLNACVLGPWSRFRYVLISPLLADELSLDETEAVLGHELGHARYGHLTFYFIVILFMAMLIAPLSTATANGWRAFPLLQVGTTMAFIMAYIYFFFGALSRQCEREADLASAELIGTPQPLIAALEKIASRNGNIRGVPCWHHGSIADRIAAVLRLSGDPGESVRFHARLRALRIGLTALAVGLMAAQLIWLA